VNKISIISVLLLCFLMFAPETKAQLYTEYSNFTFNGMVINPAFTGSNEVLTAMAAYRNKWIGFKGSPESEALTVHTPLVNNKIALGVMLFNETIGPEKSTDIYLNYAYRIAFEGGKLSLGLRAGIEILREDYTMITLSDDQNVDPAFQEIQSSVVPNFGIGIYYYTPKYFVGASIPLLLSKRVSSSTNKYESYNDFGNYNYHIMAGAKLPVAEHIKLRPAMIVRYVTSNPVQYEANLSCLLMDERFMVGASYRSSKEMILQTRVNINDQLKVSVCWDFPFSEISDYTAGTLEISLGYEFRYVIKAKYPLDF
jgi:type IX secretion system PorP/SprF family membrane protein